MPQLQLPIFPAGVTEINSQIAVQTEAGRVFYLHGHLAVFQHEEQDVRSFRMFTSQMIAGGTVKPKEIVKTFGVPMITVKRYMKLYREHGCKGFYEAKRRHSSASVLKGCCFRVSMKPAIPHISYWPPPVAANGGKYIHCNRPPVQRFSVFQAGSVTP